MLVVNIVFILENRIRYRVGKISENMEYFVGFLDYIGDFHLFVLIIKNIDVKIYYKV